MAKWSAIGRSQLFPSFNLLLQARPFPLLNPVRNGRFDSGGNNSNSFSIIRELKADPEGYSPLQLQKPERFLVKGRAEGEALCRPWPQEAPGRAICKKMSERDMRSSLLGGALHCSAIAWGPQKLAFPRRVWSLGSHSPTNYLSLMNPIMMLHNFVMPLIFSKRPHI